ncbi:MAG TPA: aminotransferase class V-fold PLP-dependent enzyme [Pyrinomonadaceae bacterium]|nr:aminotransferase class V-fold PLP-dependent enzyme [Pyrinomonadaceae bacterium]
MIYFDNNATTQVAPEVFDAMRPYLTASYGNPSSGYEFGREVSRAVDAARESVARLLGASNPQEIVFTSCGTESDNWAILGGIWAGEGKNHIVTTRVEHDAVRKLCEKLGRNNYEVTWLDVDEEGRLDLDALRVALSDKTAVVSVMLANNETGILFPVEEIASIVKEKSNALFHVDGVNAAGKIPIDLKATEIDLFSISAHKFHGPKGVGALYIRDGVDLKPFFTGGGQEHGRRAGTEAVHQIAGIGAAAEFVKGIAPTEKIRDLRDRLESNILNTIPNSRLNGTADPSKRLPNTSNISFENTNGEAILAKLDAAGVCVSTGSACNSQDHTASAVLQAMNVPYSYAMGAIRFSLGRFNTADEVDHVIDVLPGIVNDLRSLGN